MPFYLQLPNIKGNVTAKDYQNWIEFDTFEFGTSRRIVTQPGQVYNRVRSLAAATELTLIKLLDQSSPHLFEQACAGKAMPQVKIDVCHSDSNPSGSVNHATKTIHNINHLA